MHASSSTPQLHALAAGVHASSSCSTPHAPGTPSSWGSALWRRARSFSSLAAAAAGAPVSAGGSDAAAQHECGSVSSSGGAGSAAARAPHALLLQEPMTPQHAHASYGLACAQQPCWTPEQQPHQPQQVLAPALQAPAPGMEVPQLQQWMMPQLHAQLQPCGWAPPGLAQPLAVLPQQAGISQAAAMVAAVQHVQLQQLQPMLQSLQLVPVVLPAAAAAGTGLSAMFAQPPQRAAGQALAQQAGRDGLWAMSWQAASGLVQAALAQRQAATGCSNGSTAAPVHLQQQQQQDVAGLPPVLLLLAAPLCGLANAAAAALLYALAFVVSWVLLGQQQAAAAGARCAAAAAATSGAIGSCRDAFVAAAADAAGANSMEQLRAVLQLPAAAAAGSSTAHEEQCAGSNAAPLTIASAAAAVAPACGLRQRAVGAASKAQHQQQPATSGAFSGADVMYNLHSVATTLGLCAGTLLWAGRWLPGRACQQGLAVADAAASLLVEQMARAVVALAWLAARQVHALARVLACATYTHGAAAAQRAASAAQQASCAMLWCIDVATSDSSRQRSVLLSLLARLAAGVATRGAALCQLSAQVAEAAVVAVGAQLLRDASPMTITAVSGLAGMLRRNLSESVTLCWQLLLQLSAVYVSSLEGGEAALAAA